MDAAKLTLDEFNNVLGVILRNLRLSGAVGVSATPISEVAAACGFAPSTLLKECRAGTVDHVNFHGSRAMTPTQIEKFLKQYSRGGDLAAAKTSARDEMAEARAASARGAARRTSRKIA